MGKLTFLDLAEKVLGHDKKPLTPEEIWESAKINGFDKDIASTGKTPWRSIGAQIYVDLRDNKETKFVKIGSRPRRFYLKVMAKGAEHENSIIANEHKPTLKKKFDYLEKDLHPFLIYFAYTNLQAYCKTINHSKSDKKEYGEWVHPDVVGCYFPIDEWKPEVMDFSKEIGSVAIKLFSFEIKRELNFGNLRESFFQAVSNSSWANESYLVASEISKNEDFLSELQRLSTSFGIGIINIDIKDPDASAIKYPAKVREYLDWDAINKLAMNNDFKSFLKRIKTDFGSKEIRKEMYEKIYTVDELVKLIRAI